MASSQHLWIKPPGLVIVLCAALHFTYGVALWIAPGVAPITSLSLLTSMTGPFASSILIFVGGLAMMPRYVEMSRWRMQWYIWPQQTVLFLMAGAALWATWHGVYPDGTVKPPMFIFTDQCWTIYLMLAHLSASLRNLKYGPGYVVS